MFNNLTPVIRNFLILNVGVFLISNIVMPQDIVIGGGDSLSSVTFYGSAFSVNSPYFRPYQIFTSMFIHYGFFHLLMNMLALSSIGPILESYLKQKRFLMLYMAAGIFGTVLSVLLDYLGVYQMSLAAGASGAVVGVVACVAFIAPDLPVSIMFLPFQFKLKQAFIGFLVFDILGAAYSITGGNTGIGHFAHLGGALMGLFLMKIWNVNSNSNRWS